MMISLFAFDVFEGKTPFGEKLLGFLIHLAPTCVLVILLVIAWKRPLPVGILYILAGCSYFLFTSDQHWGAYLIMVGIPAVIGILFVVEYSLAKKKAPLV